VNAARSAAGHLAEKDPALRNNDDLDGIEFELAAALGGDVVIAVVVASVAAAVALNFARSLL
jgi:hypothetical protein